MCATCAIRYGAMHGVSFATSPTTVVCNQRARPDDERPLARVAGKTQRMSEHLRIAIVGAGAIGGWIGARLSASGHDVSALARGATLAALREHGFRTHEAQRVLTARVVASDRATDLGVQDLVFITVKQPALAEVADALVQLTGPQTILVSAMNGVPWWFFAGIDPAQGGPRSVWTPLQSIDPGGTLCARMPAERILGCVVHASCTTQSPGDVVHKGGNGLILGEAAGGPSARLSRVVRMLEGAGFDATASERIQKDIWYKLWGNMTMNPISAFTGATCDRILDDELVNRYVQQVMAEAAQIGSRIGCPITESARDRIEVTRRLGAFKTSMLQDVEAGRALELDALLAAPREIAARVDVATPAMDALLGLTRLFARMRGLYPH